MLFVFLSLNIITISAKQINKNEAKTVAYNILIKLKKTNEFTISKFNEIRSNNSIQAYTIDLLPTGYIVVCANTNLPPIIAYSFESNFGELNNNNPLYTIIVNDISKQNNFISKSSSNYSINNNIKWENIINANQQQKDTLFQQWPDLGNGWLKTNWTQDSPYNDFCPMDPVTNLRSIAGCPSVVIGQILNFHATTNNTYFDNLSLNRAKGFKSWQDKMMAMGGQWNFDEDSNVHFRGKENGLPYQMARYTRSVEKVAWFGVVMYIKDRDWEIIVQKEIPSSERYRGESLLIDTPFISVTPRYVLNHWEPGDVTFQMSVPEMLSEARLMLNRTVATPRMWPHILDLLRNIMGASLRANDMETYTAAMDLLRDLRTKQSQWLNNQKISYFGAQAKNLPKLAATIRQDCLAVFSDEDDFRCHQLRNDQWD